MKLLTPSLMDISHFAVFPLEIGILSIYTEPESGVTLTVTFVLIDPVAPDSPLIVIPLKFQFISEKFT